MGMDLLGARVSGCFIGRGKDTRAGNYISLYRQVGEWLWYCGTVRLPSCNTVYSILFNNNNRVLLSGSPGCSSSRLLPWIYRIDRALVLSIIYWPLIGLLSLLISQLRGRQWHVMMRNQLRTKSNKASDFSSELASSLRSRSSVQGFLPHI